MDLKQIKANANEIVSQYVAGNQSQKWMSECYIQEMEKIKSPYIESLMKKIQILQIIEIKCNQFKLPVLKFMEVEYLINKFQESKELVEIGIENIKYKLRKEQEINQNLQISLSESEYEYSNKLEILNIQKEEFIPYIFQMEEYSNSINNQMLSEINNTIDPDEQNAFKALAILIVTQTHQLQLIQQLMSREEYRQWNQAQRVFRLNNIKDILLNFDIKLVNEQDIEIIQEILRNGVLDLQNHSGFNLYNWTLVCLNYWEAYQSIKYDEEQLIQLGDIKNTQIQEYDKHVEYMNQIQIQFDQEQFQYNQAQKFIELNNQSYENNLILMDNHQRILQILKVLDKHIQFLSKYIQWRHIIHINEIIQFNILRNLSYEKCDQIEKQLYEIVSDENIQQIVNFQHTYPVFYHKFTMMYNNYISIIFDPFQIYKIFQEYLRFSNQNICSLTLASHIINYETLQLKNLEEFNYLFLMLNSMNNIKQLVEFLQNNYCKPKVIIVISNLEFEEILIKQFDTNYINLTFSMEPEDSLINFINEFFNTAKIISQQKSLQLKEQEFFLQLQVSDSKDLQLISEQIRNTQNELDNFKIAEPPINYRVQAKFIVNMYLTFKEQMNNLGFLDYLEKIQKQCQSGNNQQWIQQCIKFTHISSNLTEQEYFQKIIPIMRREYLFQMYAEIFKFLTFELYIQLIECYRISSEIKKYFQFNLEDFFNIYQTLLNQFNTEIKHQQTIEKYISQVNEQIQNISIDIQLIPEYLQKLDLYQNEEKLLKIEFQRVSQQHVQILSGLKQITNQLEFEIIQKNQINQVKLIDLDPQKCFELSHTLNGSSFELFVQIMILHNMQTDQAQIYKFFQNKSKIKWLNLNPIVSKEQISKCIYFRNTCSLSSQPNFLQYHLEQYIESIIQYNQNIEIYNKYMLTIQTLEQKRDDLINSLSTLNKTLDQIKTTITQKENLISDLQQLLEQRRIEKRIYEKHQLFFYDQATSQFKQYIQNLQNYRYSLILIQILYEIEVQSNYNLLKVYITLEPKSQENNELTSPCRQICNINTIKLILAHNIDQILIFDKYLSSYQNVNTFLSKIQECYKFIDSWMSNLTDNQISQNMSDDLINLIDLDDQTVQEVQQMILSVQLHEIYSSQDPQYMVFQVFLYLLAIDYTILKIFDGQQKAYIENILKTFLDPTHSRDFNFHLKKIFKQSNKSSTLIIMFSTAIILTLLQKVSRMEFWQIVFYQENMQNLIIPSTVNKQIERIIKINENINGINEILQEYDIGFQFEI